MNWRHIPMVAVILTLAAASAIATPVYSTPVAPADFTGQRTLASGGGLASAGSGPGWTFPAGSSVSWSIVDNGNGTFTYSYSFFQSLPSGGKEDITLSHFILELSPGCIVEGQSSCIWDANSTTAFSTDWNSGIGNSNPGMPSSIYGVKFSTGASTYTFTSDRIPVWGDFFAKKGTDGLWNLGLDPTYSSSSDILRFIPRPDTESPHPEVPEPGTMALLGAGIGALVLLRRRH